MLLTSHRAFCSQYKPHLQMSSSARTRCLWAQTLQTSETHVGKKKCGNPVKRDHSVGKNLIFFVFLHLQRDAEVWAALSPWGLWTWPPAFRCRGSPNINPPCSACLPPNPCGPASPVSRCLSTDTPLPGPHHSQKRPRGKTRRVRGHQRTFAHHGAPVLRERGQNSVWTGENTTTEQAGLR